ncbi:MAG: HepT-like ribonuclease domain-containing protein [Terrimesophilobacter sp.]
MSRTDEELVRDAVNHLEILKRHLSRNDLDDETVADAVSLRLSSAIESLSEASIAFRKRTFGDSWKVIWATRNLIAHGYAYINIAMIRSTVEQDVPELEHRLRESIGE